ncbi:MAG TPA: GNAT family N-acetyltransferase [Bacillales bacterium]|nr:GNAT family N-acetyltransferase [Bacillales bacterium]
MPDEDKRGNFRRRRIHCARQVDSWRTTYAGIAPDAYLRKMSVEKREAAWREILTSENAPCTYVVETNAGKVAGFCSGNEARDANVAGYNAELYAIYLLKKMQGKKLGSKLLQRLCADFASSGYTSMLVSVLTDNRPARRFYESMQGKAVGRKLTVIGGKSLQEVVYGWSDIYELNHRLNRVNAKHTDCL